VACTTHNDFFVGIENALTNGAKTCKCSNDCRKDGSKEKLEYKLYEGRRRGGMKDDEEEV
jgi:hypothetical protein